MKILKLTLVALFAISMFSCQKEPVLNSEADIIAMTLPEGVLIRDLVITNDKISGTANRGTDLSKLVPTFTLTKGATIDYVAGTEVDFTNEVSYTVTSENKKHKKTYTISIILFTESSVYEFEVAKQNTYKDSWTGEDRTYPFYDFYEGEMLWGSPNSGYYLAQSIGGNNDLKPADFPTSQTNDGKNGNAVVMITRSTGAMGAAWKAPIAAGSIFNGVFELNIMDQAKSAKFGTPYTNIPVAFKGFYKFKAGAENKDQSGNAVAKKDRFDVYAVMFETSEELEYLDGTNSLSHPNIVMIARIAEESCKEVDEWTEFNIPFVTLEGKSIDAEKLAAGKYSLALIFTSSVNGNIYEGTVGSTLYIDSVEILY